MFEPTFCVKRGPRDYQRLYTAGSPDGSVKTQPVGQIHGRLLRLVTETLQPASWDRPKGHRRGRPPNNYPIGQTSIKIFDTQK